MGEQYVTNEVVNDEEVYMPISPRRSFERRVVTCPGAIFIWDKRGPRDEDWELLFVRTDENLSPYEWTRRRQDREMQK